jgi:hypothetical protein
MSPSVRVLFKNALDQELMLQKGLNIRSLALQMRRLQKIEEKQPKADNGKEVDAKESTAPMADSPKVVKALDAWLESQNNLLVASFNRHVTRATRWNAHAMAIQRMHEAFEKGGANLDMCARIVAAKVAKGEKPKRDAGKPDHAAFKALKENNKAAWKALKAAVAAASSSAKRRNQAMVMPTGGDVLVEGGEPVQQGCAPSTVKCGGEGKEICSAFTSFLHNINCYNDAKEKMNDVHDMKYQFKGKCLQELEGTLKPMGKMNPKVSFKQLIAMRKACHKESKESLKKSKEAVKGPMKDAGKALKIAMKAFYDSWKTTCGKEYGALRNAKPKPAKKATVPAKKATKPARRALTLPF